MQPRLYNAIDLQREKARKAGYSDAEIDSYLGNRAASQMPAPSTPKKSGNFLTHLLPSGGGIAGAAGGAAIGTAILPGVGTLAGALLGGAFGGGAGKVAENALEHQKLTSGVAGEAAINGVLGAGPLRLLRGGVDLARGVKAGTGLADAIVNAGNNAANMSLTRAAGNKLQQSGQNLIAKEFRLNPTQQSNFKKLTGEEAVSVLRRYGVKRPEDLATKIAPLQGAFDSVIQQIPSVSKHEVSSAMKAVYEPLIKSPVITRQQLGQQLKAQAEAIVKQGKGMVPSSEVNELRQAFESAVNYTQRGTNEFTVNKKSADALRKLLQSKADAAGLKFEGKTFKDVGLELRKLRNLDDIVGKQQYLGSGSLPLNLPNLIGGGVGGAAGGIPGVLLGGVATQAINSTTGRRIAANSALKAGEKLTAKGGGTNPYGLRSLTGRIAPVGLLGASLNQTGQSSVGNNMENAATTSNTTTTPTSVQNMDGLSQANEGLSSSAAYSSPFAPQNLESSIHQILANGGSIEDATKFIGLAEAIQKIQSTGGQAPLNSTAAGVVADTKTGLQSLGSLSDAIMESNANNPLLGGLRSLNPFDTNAQNLQAQVATAKQIVGKALEGGVLRKEDEVKYAKLLPTMRDSDAVAQFKIQQLRDLISSRLNKYLGAIGGGDGGQVIVNTNPSS